jgi:RHS repeat-associated protein
MPSDQQKVPGTSGHALNREQGLAPSISLPKGGGAIRGIGEKFATNPVTGTASLSVPIAVSPGRAGFAPQLSLSYDSGAGNGPFGFGWQLAVPAITRKTEKGLPRYFDALDSDVFVLSDAEDLVPGLNDEGERAAEPRMLNQQPYTVERYRPRIEGLFARIERWTRDFDGEVHWRATSRDNVTSVYGASLPTRITDPADSARVFAWLLERSYDDKGNVIVYEYAAENGANVPPSLSEQHRAVTANRYLKRVSYSHRTPYHPDPTAAPETPLPDDWCFQLVFDYGEHDALAPRVDDDTTFSWPSRPDPFSRYRAGFEVRTYRLCRRALMFHRFAELSPDPVLVRSTDFAYAQGEPNGYSFLVSVTQKGYLRNEADGTYLITSPASGETLSPRALPPLEFAYSVGALDETVHVLDPESAEHLPVGVDDMRYQWADLDGEGAPGILTDQAGAWFYKRNLSNLPADGDGSSPVTARFAPLQLVATTPSSRELEGGQQLMDLAGDGRLCLVRFDRPLAGYYERDPDGNWRSFVPFESTPNVDWRDPNLKTVDLTGDGFADILIAEADAFTWYPSRAREGFGPPETVRKPWDEDDGPALVFADGTESVFLADVSGDGQSDLVRIRNGEVCYWPCLGYGRFGAKITMANAPLFDAPDQFDPYRVRLADVDGSGTTDMIYLGRDRVTLYFNLAGNGWSDGQPLARLPAPDELASVVVLDLLGNGTACLVWSSPLPGDAGQQMRYVDLMGGQKPHLLIGVKNNLGAETKVRYASSTRFYLKDREAGTPWATRLPFPVHVVERVETYDRLSGNRFVTRSFYHHGYFDGAEREFRGFGMVEQWDTEEIGTVPGDVDSSAVTNLDEASFVPPVRTRTWFHTGAYLDGSRVSRQFEGEYYREGDPSLGAAAAEGLNDEQRRAMLLDDSVMPVGLSAEDTGEAYRALKGSILRQEVYALDGTEAEDRPYTVSERNYAIVRLQPRGENRHAVFYTHPREAIEFHYERKLFPVGQTLRADPRVTHTLTFEVDGYGNVLRAAAVGYGRRHDDPDPLLTTADRAKQKRTLLTFAVNRYTEPVLEDEAYRAPKPCETRTYEVINVESFPDLDSGVAGITKLYRFGRLREAIDAACDGDHDIDYEDVDASGAVENHPYRRLIEHARTLYRADSLTGPLPLGTLDSLALPYEALALAFTPGLVADIYRREEENLLPDADSVLREAGYVAGDDYRATGLFPAEDAPGRWWAPSGQVFYSADADDSPALELATAVDHFFRPRRFRDPFGHDHTVGYDPHDLLPVETRDALGNTVRAVNDYRVLQPGRITDPNGNRTDAAYEVLGHVAGTARMGKETESLGDSLAGFAPDLDLATVRAFVSDPHALAPELLQGATTRVVYDPDRYARCGQPPFAASVARETHASDPAAAGGLRTRIAILYSDGFAREVQAKVQAEPGAAPERQPDVLLPGGDRAPGALVLANGQPQATLVARRWVGSGRTVYNNKGQPVKQYEPFFSATPLYEEEPEMTMTGVTPILGYDPLGRVVATLHPNHAFEKVVFDPWRLERWDVNDTVLVANPPSDEHVGAFFARLPTEDYLPTWHQEHASSPLVAEQQAAQKAAAHAGTFTVAFLDTLGRQFLTVADNGAGGKYPTRVEYDIEGNQRSVRDARGNLAARYDYDVHGTRIHQASPDAGARWLLGDIAGQPVRRWDSRGFTRQATYDDLRRLAEVWVSEGGSPEQQVERILYGESQGPVLNQRGRVFQHFDGAGVVTSVAYDFKGNLLETRRQLAVDYKSTLDWSHEVALEEPALTSRTTYDALNRPMTLTTPDGSVVRSTFNDAGLLERVEATLRGADEVTTFVDDINYNAKGQRELIVYGSGVRTAYEYDRRTFRLTRLETLRGGAHLQDLSYFYDPASNITRIADAAQPTAYYDNTQLEARSDYVYDAIYQLIEATGREHDGSGAADPPENSPQWKPHYDFTDWTRRNKTNPNDKTALRRYTERFAYDEVGNIDGVTHQPLGAAAWTRHHEYAADGNRLLGTSLPGDPAGVYSAKYAYDAHGNLTAMPHLALMEWDSEDQLRMSQRQIVNVGAGERTYCSYDRGGQRLRKVTEWGDGVRKDERLYLGSFEVYREYAAAGAVTLERETLHLMDDQKRIAIIDTKTVDAGVPLAIPAPLTRYQFGNQLGSSVLELDEAGEIISYEEYYPYGSTAYQAGASLAEVSLKRYRYTGKERDEETGLYYYGARFYAPWLGRWTRCDPAGTVDGANLYAYVRGNPVRLTDPSGTASFASPEERRQAEAFVRGESSPTVEFADDPLSGQPPVRMGVTTLDPRPEGRPPRLGGEKGGGEKGGGEKGGEPEPAAQAAAGAGLAVKVVENLAESGIRLIAPTAGAAAEGTAATGTAAAAGGGAATIPAWLPAVGIVILLGGAWYLGEIMNAKGEGLRNKTPPPGGSPPPAAGAAVAVPPPPEKKKEPERSTTGGIRTVPETKRRAAEEADRARAEFEARGGKIQRFVESPHLHHLFPVDPRLQPHWERLGINNEDPKFKVWLNPDMHLGHVHGGSSDPGGLWNETWVDFFKKHPEATLEDVMKQLEYMRKQFGI